MHIHIFAASGLKAYMAAETCLPAAACVWSYLVSCSCEEHRISNRRGQFYLLNSDFIVIYEENTQIKFTSTWESSSISDSRGANIDGSSSHSFPPTDRSKYSSFQVLLHGTDNSSVLVWRSPESEDSCPILFRSSNMRLAGGNWLGQKKTITH